MTPHPEKKAESQPKTHNLKTWPEYFQAIKRGDKPFEIRKNDRDYKVGDRLLLQEYKLLGLNPIEADKIEGEYTGDELLVEVTYLLAHKPMHANFGLEKGYCVMGVSPLSTQAKGCPESGRPTAEGKGMSGDYTWEDIANYSETAFLAGYANGGLSAAKIIKALRDWKEENLPKPPSK